MTGPQSILPVLPKSTTYVPSISGLADFSVIEAGRHVQSGVGHKCENHQNQNVKNLLCLAYKQIFVTQGADCQIRQSLSVAANTEQKIQCKQMIKYNIKEHFEN